MTASDGANTGSPWRSWPEPSKWAKTNAQADRAQPLGIHLEGPFLSHARRGVHPSRRFCKPLLRAFVRAMWEAAAGEIA